MLLRTNHHAGAHESHESNDLVRSETIAVDQVSTNQTSSTTQASLAVDSNSLVLDGDHVVGELYEFAYQLQRWAGSIFKDHVDVGDAHSSEVRGAV